MLVHAWVPLQGIYFALNPVSWSVSTEVFFYMLFPLLVLDWGRTWAWKLALSFALLAAVVAFGNVVPVPSYSAGDAGVTTQALVYIHPFARLFEFTLGMASLLLFPAPDALARVDAGRGHGRRGECRRADDRLGGRAAIARDGVVHRRAHRG
jgi:peptidoglycan/LPS O-acetylase OafA/YrhL